jgi:uncharacterized protein (TIGR01370 family)
MRAAVFAGIAVSALVAAGCAGMTTGSNGTNGTMPGIGSSPVGNVDTTSSQSPKDLSSVKSWSIDTAKYVGKPATAEDLAADTSDLLIVSPTELVTKDHLLDKQVATIRGKMPKRVILALVDLGYVGPSSDLWNASWLDSSGRLSATAPDWLVPLATDSSRYRVRYWEADWQKKFGDDVDRLRKAGFDGICIDGLGAYSAFLADRPSSAVDMAATVETVARDARVHAANFYIVPIDDDALVDRINDKQRTDYVKVVDGVVGENVFYHGDKAVDNDLNPQADMITGLDRYQYAHKPVFVVDRVTAAEKVADFKERAKARGYLPCGSAGEVAAAAPASDAPAKTAPATSAGG